MPLIFTRMLLACMILLIVTACDDSDLLDFEHSDFHLPTGLSATDNTTSENISSSIKSSRAAYSGLVKLIDAVFQDANTQSRYIMCSTYRIYHLSRGSMSKKTFPSVLKRVMQQQSLIHLQYPQDATAYMMIPMARTYKDAEKWHVELEPLLDEQATDIEAACSERFNRPVPNSSKARGYEKQALAKYLVLSLQRLQSLKKSLLQMEELASLYTSFETTLSKVEKDAKQGLINPMAMKEKLAAYNEFLHSVHNKLPEMSDKMPIESEVSDKELAKIMRIF